MQKHFPIFADGGDDKCITIKERIMGDLIFVDFVPIGFDWTGKIYRELQIYEYGYIVKYYSDGKQERL